MKQMDLVGVVLSFFVEYVLHLIIIYNQAHVRNPGSFVSWGPTLTTIIREDPNTTLSGP